MLGCFPIGAKTPPGSPPKNSSPRRRVNSLRGNLVTKYTTPIEADYVLFDQMVLGSGSFGLVIMANSRVTNVSYAVKFVQKGSATPRVEREIKLLADIDHINVARLYSVYDSPKKVGLVMELCSGGNLQQLHQTFTDNALPEPLAKVIIRQLVSAVAHIHSRGMCHRDIKLQNVLLATSDHTVIQAKLIDFGYATRFVGVTLTSRVGTPYTIAPEVLRENYDERCDVWSVGIIAYILLSGRRPFESDMPRGGLYAKILKSRYNFNHPRFSSVSYEAVDFIKKMLEANYLRRWYAQDALCSAWLSDSVLDRGNVDARDQEDTTIAKAMGNLRAIDGFTKLSNVAMIAVAFGLPPNETAEIRTLFDALDVDFVGYLTPVTFRDAMHEVNLDLSVATIDRLFSYVDVDCDDQVSFIEFMAATLDPHEVGMEKLERAFRLFDAESKGYITFDDLYRVLALQPKKRRTSKLSRNAPTGKAEDLSKSGDDMFAVAHSIAFIKTDREKKLSAMIRDMIKENDHENVGAITFNNFITGVLSDNPRKIAFSTIDPPSAPIQEDSPVPSPGGSPVPRAAARKRTTWNERLSFTDSLQFIFRRRGRKTFPVARKSAASEAAPSPLAVSQDDLRRSAGVDRMHGAIHDMNYAGMRSDGVLSRSSIAEVNQVYADIPPDDDNSGSSANNELDDSTHRPV